MNQCAQKGFTVVRHADPVRCADCETLRTSVFACRTCDAGFCEPCMIKHGQPPQPVKDPNDVATKHDSSG